LKILDQDLAKIGISQGQCRCKVDKVVSKEDIDCMVQEE